MADTNQSPTLQGRLDDLLLQYYARQEVPRSRIQSTLEMGRAHQAEARAAQQFRRVHFSWMAALLLVSLGIGALVFYKNQTREQPTRQAQFSPLLAKHITDLVAHEVYKNHAKGSAPEIASADLALIERRLQKLPFRLAHLQEQIPPGSTLQGARYCSLQGRLAVQLSLQSDHNNSHQTLYVVDRKRHLAALPDQARREVQGLPVRFWSVAELSLILIGK